MMNAPFYTDVSTYTPDITKAFYENVFGWKFFDSDDYYVGYLVDKQVVGLYETPEKFKQMRMPHFWMTYFKVNHLDNLVTKAKDLAGIIEVSYQSSLGKIALIRDPKGAGFTLYEGDELQNIKTNNTPNTLIWNELQVSEAQKVIPFYQELFGWKIKQASPNTFNVFTTDDNYILDILELSNTVKGKYEYWVNTFGVANIKETQTAILRNGGSLIQNEGERMLFTDNSNEAFFYIQAV